ncbi:unnamed protein product [Closterium sp. NIES-65]|nr:unnamed protein product [Closterium sp. NIES-65]
MDRFTRQRADLTSWKSRDAAACIALRSLLPESEEAHFTQVRTTSEFLTAIKARYATPTTVSLGRLFLPFLFPDLASVQVAAEVEALVAELAGVACRLVAEGAQGLERRLVQRPVTPLLQLVEATPGLVRHLLVYRPRRVEQRRAWWGVRPLVSQHVGVWIEPSGETAVCVDGDTYTPLATFTAEPGSGLYTLHTGSGGQQQQRLLPPAPVPSPSLVPASHQVAASPQVAVSGKVPMSCPVAASCSCRSLAHPTVLWHHWMGHLSLPCLRTMSRQCLVLGLPHVFPSLPPSLAPPCGPCVEGRLRATPHSSSLRLATEPFETFHLDVWGPASRLGLERERFFLVVVDDYSRYTTMSPLAKKSEVTSTLIRYAAHQLNLWPRVSRPEISPTSLWTGSPGVASRFRVLAMDRFTRQRADLTSWKSRDAAACIALRSLLPESEEAHFTQVRTTSEFLTAIKARYATPTTVSLGRLFLPFLFPDLASVQVAAEVEALVAELAGVACRLVAEGAQGLERRLVQRPVTPLLQLVEATPGLVRHLLVYRPRRVEQRRVTSRYTTTLPCPAVPCGSLTGFHVPSFSQSLVGVRPLVSQHVGVWIEPSGETAVCVDGDTYTPLATFTAEPGSGLYTLHTGSGGQQQQRLLPPAPVPSPSLVPASHQVAASPQVAVSGKVPMSCPVAASCSCRSLAHPTVLWHHWMGHLSLPCLRTMSRQCLVLGLPHVFPSLPPSLAPPCGPCVEGRLRATPHSSSLRLATEPFETFHLDVWGPASRLGLERERFFLVVVDDYSRYTTMSPLAKKSEVTSTLIRWLLTTEGTRSRRVSCLHSDRGGEFRSGILAGFCRE